MPSQDQSEDAHKDFGLGGMLRLLAISVVVVLALLGVLATLGILAAADFAEVAIKIGTLTAIGACAICTIWLLATSFRRK